MAFVLPIFCSSGSGDVGGGGGGVPCWGCLSVFFNEVSNLMRHRLIQERITYRNQAATSFLMTHRLVRAVLQHQHLIHVYAADSS